MKYIISLLLAASFYCQLAAQTNQQKNDSVFQIVVNYLNTQEAAQIYPLVNKDFQNAVSLDKLVADSKTLYHMGKMQAQFESYKNGLNKYKLRSPVDSVSMSIALDSTGKIAAFFFGPYFDDYKKKSEVLTNNEMSTQLDRLVDSASRPYVSLQVNSGLSIGILKDGKPYFYGYGEKVKGNRQLPDEHTLFEIGSITKTFTATLLADAVNSGKISLNDPVNKYLPDTIPTLQFEGVPATIKMLSNHSSSIPRMPSNFASKVKNQSDPYNNYEISDLYSFYITLKLTRKPGTVSEYSNVAAATLGIILENLYQKSFETLVTEKILKPLNMTETMQFIREKDSGRVAAGYGYQGRYNGPWNLKTFRAAGGLRSTAADMLRYAQANIACKDPVLNKSIQLTHILTWDKPRMGLGWGLPNNNAAHDDYITHDGGTGGYMSSIIICPKREFAVIVLSNSAAEVMSAGQISKDIMQGIVERKL